MVTIYLISQYLFSKLMIIIHLIMIIYRKTHENITLFHYSGYYHILFETHGYCLYLKPMVTIILKKNIEGHYLKSPKENIICKIIHSKNYEKLYELLFKAYGN